MVEIEQVLSELEMSKAGADEIISATLQALRGAGSLAEMFLALASRYNGPEDSLKAVIAGYTVAVAVNNRSE